jgi:hypothetical protein
MIEGLDPDNVLTTEGRLIELDNVMGYMWVTENGTYTIDPKEIIILLKKPEPRIDYNTVVMKADGHMIRHTYDPNCPEGCHGQLDTCLYKQEHEEVNDATT